MKQLLIYLINPILPLTVYIVGCNTNHNASIQSITNKSKQENKSQKSSKPKKFNADSLLNYDSIKEEIKLERKKVINYYKKASTNSLDYASSIYLHLFENKMAPIWIGTSWDFNGTTKTPGKGNIACGYFVTTTLYDMGIDINIAKFAQCGSDVMVKHLIETKNYTNLSNLGFDDFIKHLKGQKPFLAIIGLDFHTGYILNNGKELYFIHSSYINRRGVIQQIASECGELKSSKWKSLGYISKDAKFMKNWLNIKP